MQKIIIFLLAVSLFSCVESNDAKKLKIGTYRGYLIAQDNQEIPFIFEVISEHK